jgi:hypothetical protein
MIDHIAFVEQAGYDGYRLIGLWMDHAGFSAETAPTAFRFNFAMHGIGARPLNAGTRALRHLKETILQNLGAYGDRFEKRVVARIARQGITFERRWQGRSDF